MEFPSPTANVPATGVLHFNADPMAPPVCELNCRFGTQTIATQVLNLDSDASFQRVAASIIRFNCHDSAPGKLHLNHRFIERAHGHPAAQ